MVLGLGGSEGMLLRRADFDKLQCPSSTSTKDSELRS